jgi:hypothetical protein
MKTPILLLTSVVLCIALGGCDLPTVVKDVDALTAGLKSNKDMVEQLASDLKRSYSPEDPEYQKARTLFETARAANDDYLAKMSLAALTADQSISLSSQATTAHTTTTTFASTAAQTLDPSDSSRALPFAALVAVIPPLIHRFLSQMPSNRRPAAVAKVLTVNRWRTWDELPTTSARFVSDSKKQKKKKKQVTETEE